MCFIVYQNSVFQIRRIAALILHLDFGVELYSHFAARVSFVDPSLLARYISFLQQPELCFLVDIAAIFFSLTRFESHASRLGIC